MAIDRRRWLPLAALGLIASAAAAQVPPLGPEVERIATGADGAAYVRAQPGRIKTIHIKAFKRDDAAALVGEDSVPWAAVFEACETVGGTEWYIVEHEDYGSLTPMQCIEGCLRNLRAMGK